MITTQAVSVARQQEGENNIAAAIDLGSNSFHILVGEFINGDMRPMHCWGEKVQLAEGLDRHTNLSAAAKQRAFDCLSRFAEAIAGVPAGQVRVVGTHALRRAADSAEFVAQAETLLGVPIDVITGEQEAHIIYQGVLAGKKAKAEAILESALVIDIGGGSTEVVLGKGDEIQHCASLPMGCVGYSHRYFPQQSCTLASFKQSLQALKADLEPVQDLYSSTQWQQAIGTAGTALAIESVLKAQGWASAGISHAGLEKFAALLCQGKNVAAMQLQGLTQARFDIVTAGVAIMLAIFQMFGIEHLETSADSLREGLIYSMRPQCLAL